MAHQPRPTTRGPFRAEQIREGDPYELSNGHPIQCLPGGREHADRNLTGAALIASDPDVEWAGIDAGYSPEPGTLRAPDVAVGASGSETGWIPGAPALAVEYADQGQNEDDLQDKIGDLLRAGTRLIWVVRLTGPRRVEVHTPGAPPRVVGENDTLTAPGILRNPVAVAALYDRDTAKAAVLRNLLQGQGYASLDEVRLEGRSEGEIVGQAQSLLAVLEGRGLSVTADERTRILECTELERRRAWLLRAGRVRTAAELFE
jgi:Uma2 family endonuclease